MTKIMTVEDRPETLSLVEKIVTRAGYEFVGYLNGEECIKNYDKEKPDLVLLDIMLPGIDGYEVYEEIKSRNADQKIVFLSALDISVRAQVRLRQYGMPQYINKPFDPPELLAKVKEVLGK